jgi:hypothetical protein
MDGCEQRAKQQHQEGDFHIAPSGLRGRSLYTVATQNVCHATATASLMFKLEL